MWITGLYKRPIEVRTPDDLRCALALLPTDEEVERAKIAAQIEREQVMRDTPDIWIDSDGHVTEAA